MKKIPCTRYVNRKIKTEWCAYDCGNKTKNIVNML